MTAEQINMITCGQPQYVALVEQLFYNKNMNIYPIRDYRDFIQEQLLHGMKPREVQSNICTGDIACATLHRIKKHVGNKGFGWIRTSQTMENKYVINLTTRMYWQILKPLQLEWYPNDLTPYQMYYLVHTKVRNNYAIFRCMYRHDVDMLEFIRTLVGCVQPSKGRVIQDYGRTLTMAEQRLYGIGNQWANVYCDNDTTPLEIICDEHIQVLYELLQDLSLYGYLNDCMIEGDDKYEYIQFLG